MGTSFSITEADSNDGITLKLQSRQTLVTVLNWLQAFGVFYLICQTLVVGYAIVSTPSGTAVPHAIWLLAPLLACLVVAHTTRFEVGLYLDTITAGMRYTYVVLALAIITNGVALGLFVWELVQGLSNFFVLSYGYLIATVAVTGVFLVCEILLFFAVWVLHRDLGKFYTFFLYYSANAEVFRAEHAWRMGWKPRYSQYDPQYHHPQKDKMDEQERLWQAPPPYRGNNNNNNNSTSAPPTDDFDIDIKNPIRNGIRNTRVVIQGRKLLK